MKKVALIAPGRGKIWGICEPLNLAYLAAHLRNNNIDVIIIDEIAGQNVEDEINRFIPDVVGITATTPLAPDAYRIAALCKSKGILTVMGGVHATVMPEEAIQHVDIVVKGEGERAILDIINKGIQSGIIESPYIEEIDEVPLPARDLLDQDFYLYAKKRLGDIVGHLLFAANNNRIANILTSRGCPYKCIFCHNNWKGSPIRFHSPERIISEIKDLIKSYKIDALFFLDDNFCARKSRLKEVCNLMVQENIKIPWACNATSNNIDKETAELLRKSGCRQVMFGFESGSQKMLNVLGKRTKVEKNLESVNICKEAGLLVTASFMIGNPTETVQDILETQKFISDIVNTIDMVGVNITTPYPGTQIWNDLKEKGLIPDKLSWNDFCQDELPVRVCYEIEPDELKRLHLETASIKPMKLSRIWSRIFLNPFKAARVFSRDPITSAKILFNTINPKKFRTKKC